MSFRYKIKILKKDKVINSTQLFGNNDYIKNKFNYGMNTYGTLFILL